MSQIKIYFVIAKVPVWQRLDLMGHDNNNNNNGEKKNWEGVYAQTGLLMGQIN